MELSSVVNHDTKDMTRHYMSLALSLTPYLLERIMELNQYLCMMNADANLIRIRYLCFLFLFIIPLVQYIFALLITICFVVGEGW